MKTSKKNVNASDGCVGTNAEHVLEVGGEHADEERGGEGARSEGGDDNQFDALKGGQRGDGHAWGG